MYTWRERTEEKRNFDSVKLRFLESKVGGLFCFCFLRVCFGIFVCFSKSS